MECLGGLFLPGPLPCVFGPWVSEEPQLICRGVCDRGNGRSSSLLCAYHLLLWSTHIGQCMFSGTGGFLGVSLALVNVTL